MGVEGWENPPQNVRQALKTGGLSAATWVLLSSCSGICSTSTEYLASMKFMLGAAQLLWVPYLTTASLLERQVSSSVSSSVSNSGVSSSTSSVFTVATPGSNPTVNSSNHDLSQHFCRLWRHQSVYVEGKIYIDGGNTYIPTGDTTFSNTSSTEYVQGMNDILLVLDLSNNFTNQDTAPYSAIDKGPQVPNAIIEGALWWSAVTRKIYQLGGWFSTNSNQDPGYITSSELPPSSIWEFDVDLKTWVQSAFNYVNTGTKVDRPGAAANCDAPALNKSFIFEGYVEYRSDIAYNNWSSGASTTFKFLEGMLQLDSNTSPPTLSNISVPTYVGPRMNGAMIHVPVGPKGVIVQIAGQTTVDPTPFGIPILSANQKNTEINNTYVDIYDIESGYWFRQQTFGVPDVPTSRADICVILVTAPDQSSYNIFMVAGVLTYNVPITSEEMWVLTIPTFQWVKVHTRPGGYYGHTCHQVGENLVIVGGMETNAQGGNANNCSSHMPAEIFSLASMNYTGVFDAAGAQRAPPVPADVVTLIGGTSTGGAVVTKPYLWSDLYLQYVFNPSLQRPAYTPTYTLANATGTTTNTTTPTPTPSSSPSHVPAGAIAGGVVGGIAVIALAIFLIIFFARKKKARKEAEILAAADPNVHPHPTNELPTYQDAKDQNAVEVSAYQQPLVFSHYQPSVPANLHPAEMYAGEENDRFVTMPDAVPERSPRVGSPGRFSEMSYNTGGSPSLEPMTPLTPGGRHSRQSEVSRTSVGGQPSPRMDSGRLSRQSEVSGPSEP
ncbi:uncharacterized protein LY89DRAFT_731509 [Mollisia scopiformis]|uniref:Kelch repeat-containing protein n=1 Tax=Mollisia scopiformis TaxID=149040 RepID=A0A194XG18_MOLSC|nr:uncharacterized protein LY89DRAFT_731509 [Mollisia scopiformis]KUJ19086.1 hypothetical protein LY89DRAFT_731509 [Mollisia scopiformis]